MRRERGSCQEVNPCHLPGNNQPDTLDQAMGNKKRPSATPQSESTQAEADPQLPAWSIQVSCPVDGG
jgi:hypothetical protein